MDIPGLENMVAVEVPGEIRTQAGIDRAVQSLGGSADLQSLWGNRTSLLLRFDPSDPFSKFLSSTTLSLTNDILLQVNRKKLRRKVKRRVRRQSDVQSSAGGTHDTNDSVTLEAKSSHQEVILHRSEIRRKVIRSPATHSRDEEDKTYWIEVVEELDKLEFCFIGRPRVLFRFVSLADFHLAPPLVDLDRDRLSSKWRLDPGSIPPGVLSSSLPSDDSQVQRRKGSSEEVSKDESEQHLSFNLNSFLNFIEDAESSSANICPNDILGTSSAVTSPLFMPPPMYTRVSYAFPYRYEQNALASTAKYYSGGKRDEEADPLNLIFKYSDAEVPCEPPPASLKYSIDTELLTIYSKLFEERPMWLRQMLEKKLPSKVSSWKKKPLLSRTCFTFANGPWRTSLCRLGFDPRLPENKEARIYQTIDFRDPHFRSIGWRSSSLLANKIKQKAKQQAMATTITSDAHDTTVPTVDIVSKESPDLDSITFRSAPLNPSQIYQLCDIADPAIQQVLISAPFTQECSKESGWYPLETLQRVRNMMAVRSKSMRDMVKLHK